MHDNMSVAFRIGNPFKKKGTCGVRPRLITIWHCDPETDGTDDSCGHFIRARHIPVDIMEAVKRDFEFNFNHHYWFTPNGELQRSVIGTVLEMYRTAAWTIFMQQNGGKPDRDRHIKFMMKHLYEIIYFSENAVDSLHSILTNKYGAESPEVKCERLHKIIATDIYRMDRKWWQQPKWHVHHWKIQFHPYQDLKRRYWDKCCVCGKRGFKGSAMSNWSGSKLWHRECNGSPLRK
jgi:hypothetical protein